MTRSIPTVVVGVVPGQHSRVVAEAATFAERFGGELVCASVDASSYTLERRPDGTVTALPVDPDAFEEIVEEFDPGLREAISTTLAGRSVSWSTVALAGPPAQELTRLADQVDAAMIVVGTRESGIRASLREFLSGSVAVHLAHHQHRPVVVIPLAAHGEDITLPWEDEG
ncbi:universal stress protein [Brachybacterium endophyticum]|uniref:Universal stress protein n=1 Tax=Brachybacterium endophyticum TaxID=2182385 RepID=A0A2U2RIX7_9MICO|nr:universal stress protein [Brachybacterium endophyticum]PWH05745.1 universal stress protein [Brachybacterium endophyticum]